MSSSLPTAGNAHHQQNHGTSHETRRDVSLPESPRRISAVFLNPRPSGYTGRDILHYSFQDWRLLLQELKDVGVDTVILAALADLDRRECYYSSRVFSAFTIIPILDDFLHAAEHEDMAVFLGSPAGSFTGAEVESACLAGCAELTAYRASFHGFYIPWPDGIPDRSFPSPASLNAWLAGLSRDIHRLAPEMLILVSPPAGSILDQPPDIQMLETVFTGAGVDILAPHDGIGSSLSSLADLPSLWAAWHALTFRLDISLWAVVDLFESRGQSGDPHHVSAGFSRLSFQLAAAAVESEKTAAVDMHFWMTHFAGSAGSQLRKEYMENVDLGFVDK